MLGIDITRKRVVVFGLESTSSLATCSPLSLYCSASSATSGATRRHGPHQTAQKSTMCRPDAFSTSSAKLASVTSRIISLVAIRLLLVPVLLAYGGGRSIPPHESVRGAPTARSRGRRRPLHRREPCALRVVVR